MTHDWQNGEVDRMPDENIGWYKDLCFKNSKLTILPEILKKKKRKEKKQ